MTSAPGTVEVLAAASARAWAGVNPQWMAMYSETKASSSAVSTACASRAAVTWPMASLPWPSGDSMTTITDANESSTCSILTATGDGASPRNAARRPR